MTMLYRLRTRRFNLSPPRFPRRDRRPQGQKFFVARRALTAAQRLCTYRQYRLVTHQDAAGKGERAMAAKPFVVAPENYEPALNIVGEHVTVLASGDATQGYEIFLQQG